MNRRQKIIVSVTGIFIVLLALVGITYGYFLTTITDNSAERSIEIATANLELVYNDGTPEIDLSGITPLYTSEVQSKGLVKTFTISKTTASDNVYAKIKLINLSVPTAVATYDLKWALYKGTTPVATGDFGGKTSGEIVMATNKLIDSTTGSTYNLYIWINETGLDQSTMMNQTITAKIDVIGYGKAEETLASKILENGTKYITNTSYEYTNCIQACLDVGSHQSTCCDQIPVYEYSEADKTIYTTPTFTTTSTDRGLYVQKGDETKSEMGFPTYYYRGDITGNYVKLGEYQTTDGGNTVGDDILWRVIRINEDGSIKLISENVIYSNIIAGPTPLYIKADGTDSTAKSTVESWYNSNIGNNTNFDNKVVISSFCNDNNPGLHSATSAVSDRISESSPIFTCPVGAINAYEKVGLITADEAVYGGLLRQAVSNNPSYLIGNSSYWTLSAGYAANFLRIQSTYGNIWFSSGVDISTPADIRAVINLSPDVVVSGGDGLSSSTAWVIE